MRIQQEFPDYRYHDPKRQAERRVYQEIAGSQIPGQALYEVNATRHTPQVDFLVWVKAVACFAVSVKGGTYSVDNGNLFLRTPEGLVPAKNVLQQALDGALSVRNALNSHLNRAFFVIAVLLFPDMEPDPEIECWADKSRTNVMFGTHNLVERLMALNDVKTVRFPPSAEQIDEEVDFINGRRPADNPVPVPGDGAMALTAQQVVIQHVETLNLYTTQLPHLGIPQGHAAGDEARETGESGEATA